MEDKLILGSYEQEPSIVFVDRVGTQIGRLFLTDGELDFEGYATKSGKKFIEYLQAHFSPAIKLLPDCKKLEVLWKGIVYGSYKTNSVSIDTTNGDVLRIII